MRMIRWGLVAACVAAASPAAAALGPSTVNSAEGAQESAAPATRSGVLLANSYFEDRPLDYWSRQRYYQRNPDIIDPSYVPTPRARARREWRRYRRDEGRRYRRYDERRPRLYRWLD